MTTKAAPRVAVVNREFARKVFGSSTNAMGGYYKMRDGTRVQVVGIVEDGKYTSLTEDPQPAMFLPILQSPSSSDGPVVRSSRDPQQLAAAIRRTLRDLDTGLPVVSSRRGTRNWTSFCLVREWRPSLGVLGVMGAMLSITGIFGMAAYSVSKRLRSWEFASPSARSGRKCYRQRWDAPFKLLAFGSAAGLLLGILATRVLALIVYQATPRDPLVLAGVVLGNVLAGATGHVDSSAARAVG